MLYPKLKENFGSYQRYNSETFSNEDPQQSALVRWTGSSEQLVNINKKNNSLVIWTRSLPVEVESALKSQSKSTLAGFHKLLDAAHITQPIYEEINSQKSCPSSVRNWLANDIINLVRLFIKVTNSNFIDIRLEWIHSDACWKFHRDFVDIRLLTTYVGKTTEWVDKPFGEEALEKQRAYDKPINRLNPNDVAIFNGCRQNPKNGIVHRSPPLRGSDEPRLFLCLNIPGPSSPLFEKK
jgi:hypothetical protein